MDYLRDLDFDVIRYYCGQEASFRLQGAIRNLSDVSIKIVNTGMVSSGKSSLYNILTGNTEQERFPTGAARTTTRADSCTYKNMVFVDTPGIDVRDQDDEIAFETIMESDIVLMVHNIKTGPLTRTESDWLERIASGMTGPEMRKMRLIFVCTWKDTREKEEGYEAIVEEVKRMVYEIVGTEIPFFEVSVKKYLNGIMKNKQVLCEKSGIPELGSALEAFAAIYANAKNYYAWETFRQTAEETILLLDKEKEKREEQIQKEENRVKMNFQSRYRSWDHVFSYFKSKREALDEMKRDEGMGTLFNTIKKSMFEK